MEQQFSGSTSITRHLADYTAKEQQYAETLNEKCTKECIVISKDKVYCITIVRKYITYHRSPSRLQGENNITLKCTAEWSV